MKKEVIYTVFIIAAVLLIVLYVTRKTKYYKYFNEQLGFGTEFLDKFTNSELKDIYEYLRDYPRKGKVLTYAENPSRYMRMISIDNKHGNFLDLPLS